jgi:hypothetical protein
MHGAVVPTRQQPVRVDRVLANKRCNSVNHERRINATSALGECSEISRVEAEGDGFCLDSTAALPRNDGADAFSNGLDEWVRRRESPLIRDLPSSGAALWPRAARRHATCRAQAEGCCAHIQSS